MNYRGLFRMRRLRRKILNLDARMRDDYLLSSREPKLQIGGGWRLLDGWLNTDIDLVPDVMFMDATRSFPFEDNLFQFVFSEHMIEHVHYEKAVSMLRECHRVMRKGGVIRVVTPDLSSIVGLYRGNLSEIQQSYLSWFCATFVQGEYPQSAVAVINAHFRLWGHQFIYDEETLTATMSGAGFSEVTRCSLGKSDYSMLRSLENEGRYPPGLLDFESVALEGTK